MEERGGEADPDGRAEQYQGRAFCIDLVVLLPFAFVVLILLEQSMQIDPPKDDVEIFLMLCLLAFFMILPYSFLLEGLWNGQTVGKKIFGIKVVTEDGEPIGFRESGIRNLFRPVALGDRLAGTVLVRAPEDRWTFESIFESIRRGEEYWGEPDTRQKHDDTGERDGQD